MKLIIGSGRNSNSSEILHCLAGYLQVWQMSNKNESAICLQHFLNYTLMGKILSAHGAGNSKVNSEIWPEIELIFYSCPDYLQVWGRSN